MPNEPVRVQPICLNGRVNPGRHQVKFPPTEETSVAHKLAMDWASFYNGVAHGLAVLGFESAIGRGRVNKRYGRDKSGTDGDGNRSRDISGTFLGLTLGAGCGVNVTTNTTNIPSPTKLLASKKRLNKGEGRIRGGFTCGNISNLPNSSFSANLPEVQLSINVIRF
jgi:hypothetical protein